MNNENELFEEINRGRQILEIIKEELSRIDSFSDLKTYEMFNSDYIYLMVSGVKAWHEKILGLLDESLRYGFSNSYIIPSQKELNKVHELYIEMKAYCDYLNGLDTYSQIKVLNKDNTIKLNNNIFLKNPSEKERNILYIKKNDGYNELPITYTEALLINRLYTKKKHDIALSVEELAGKLNLKVHTLQNAKAKLNKICKDYEIHPLIFVDVDNKWSLNPALKCS